MIEPIEPMLTFGTLLLGGLVQFIIGNFVSLSSTDVELVNNQIDQITKVENSAVNYWHHDASDDPPTDAALASIVNGTMSATALFEKDAKRLMKNQYPKYELLDGDLYDLVTGGAFQTAGKTPDYDRVVEIITKCNEIRAFLRSTRRSVFTSR